jgi:hypothetical protein
LKLRRTIIASSFPFFTVALALNACDDDSTTATTRDGGLDARATSDAMPVIDATGTDANDTDAADAAVCATGDFSWATTGGAMSQGQEVHGVASDKDGNAWITGTFIGSATWGTFMLTSTDNVHTTAFVAKLDPAGKVLFAAALNPDPALGNGGLSANGARVRVDAAGNAYVVGTFIKSIKIDSVNLVQQNTGGYGAAFVIKFDPTGKAVWGAATANNGGSDENGYDVAVDTNGDVYVAGSYNGQASFRNYFTDGGVATQFDVTAATGGEEKPFLAKYSQTQNAWVWAKGWIGQGNDGGVAYAVTITPTGVVVGGQISAEIDIDGTTLNADAGSFLVKTDKTDGHVLWATQISAPAMTNQTAKIHALASDSMSHVFMTGEYTPSVTFESASVVGPLGADGGTDGGDAGAGSISLKVTDTGADMFLAEYDTNGAPVWAKHAGVANANVRGDDVFFDGTSALYVSGFKQGSTVFDTKTLTPTGDLFVARYDTSGVIQWVTGNDGGPNGSVGGEGFGVCYDWVTGGAIVAGSFAADMTLGSLSVKALGDSTGLVARVCN